jgi:Protein of unknown function (DUF3592)
MTTETAQKGPLMWLGLIMLVLLFGLCTVFASVVTAAQAWQEHAQTRWPEVTGRVDNCGLIRTSSNEGRKFYIACRLSYAVGAEQHERNIHSMNFPAPEIWQYPPNQGAPFVDWVNAHPDGTPMVVRYDPANHANAVLATDNMPGGGLRTSSNVKQVEFWAGGFLVLLAIARITRPSSLLQNRHSSMRPNP